MNKNEMTAVSLLGGDRQPLYHLQHENKLSFTIRISTINHWSLPSAGNKRRQQSFHGGGGILPVLISKLWKGRERERKKSKTHYLSFQPFGVNQPGPYIMYTTVDANGYFKNGSGKTAFFFVVDTCFP